MTASDAMNFFSAEQARKAIADDPSAGWAEKARSLARFAEQADRPSGDRRWTVGDVIHGAIGAALGAGLAKGISRSFGLGPAVADKVQTIAMGVGAAMNTGVIKRAEDRKNAFQLGYVQGLNATGHFNKTATIKEEDGKFVLYTKDGSRVLGRHASREGALKQERAIQQSKHAQADSPEDIDRLYKRAAFMPIMSFDIGGLAEIPKGIGRAISGAGRATGALGGQAMAMDATDEAIAKIQVEKALLEEQLERIEADKRNAALKSILAKRRTQR